MRSFIAWLKKSKPVRVGRTYNDAGGNVLAAGMSFEALFAVFAAVWVGFSITGIFLNGHPEIQQTVIDFINSQIPGLIVKGGPIDPSAIASISTLGWTGGLAIVVVMYTAINWLHYSRIAIRKMFGLTLPKINIVLIKIYDLLIALTYGFLVLLTAVGSVALTQWADQILKLFGISNLSPLALQGAQISGLFLLTIVDAAIIAAMILVISAVSIPWGVLLRASLYGAVALGLLKFFASLLLHRPESNPLLVSAAVGLGLLIYFNLASRIFLITVAWIEIGLRDMNIKAKDLSWLSKRPKKNRTASVD